MSDSEYPKRKRHWYQFSLRELLIMMLLVISGCGSSKEEQAIDACRRGVAHYERGDLDEAIAEYTTAIRLYPKCGEAYFRRGRAFAGKREFDKAITDFTEAIRLKPEFAEAYYYRRALIYSEQRKYDQAIADYTETIRIKPEDAKVYYNRGRTYALNGEQAKAEADFAKARELGFPPE